MWALVTFPDFGTRNGSIVVADCRGVRTVDPAWFPARVVSLDNTLRRGNPRGTFCREGGRLSFRCAPKHIWVLESVVNRVRPWLAGVSRRLARQVRRNVCGNPAPRFGRRDTLAIAARQPEASTARSQRLLRRDGHGEQRDHAGENLVRRGTRGRARGLRPRARNDTARIGRSHPRWCTPRVLRVSPFEGGAP
jgi:hypothetical protein